MKKDRIFLKKVYLSSVEGPNRKGRPLGRWEDKVKEYVSVRGARGNGLEWERRECIDREGWRNQSAKLHKSDEQDIKVGLKKVKKKGTLRKEKGERNLRLGF